MKQRSRHVKGRRLQILLRDKILKAFRHLKKSDVEIPGTGEIGADIKLSRIAKRLVPFQFEAKSQQKFRTLYKFYNQCERHGNLDSVLVIKSNSRKPLAIVDLDTFIDLIK